MMTYSLTKTHININLSCVREKPTSYQYDLIRLFFSIYLLRIVDSFISTMPYKIASLNVDQMIYLYM